MSLENAEKFDRDTMIELFKEAGRILKERGIIAEIVIYGGSSIMLEETLFDSYKRLTEDIDYVPIVESLDKVETLDRLFEQASTNLNMEKVYRNDVKDLISSHPEHEFFNEFPVGEGNLRVYKCSAEYILSMKVKAMRSSFDSNDPEDIWHLMDVVDLETPEQVLEKVNKFFPFDEISGRNKKILTDIIELKNSGGEYTPMVGW